MCPELAKARQYHRTFGLRRIVLTGRLQTPRWTEEQLGTMQRAGEAVQRAAEKMADELLAAALAGYTLSLPKTVDWTAPCKIGLERTFPQGDN